VSVLDGDRHAYLAGPFEKHETALALVDTVRTLACEVDPKAWWYAFGTCSLPKDMAASVRFPELGIEPAP
jgi:hypothetical protein